MYKKSKALSPSFFWVFIFLSFGACLSVDAQKKELTLETALSGIYRDIYSQKPSSLQWLPKSKKYAYIFQDTLFVNEVNGTEIKKITKANLNSALINQKAIFVDSLSRLPEINFLDDSRFWIIYNQQIIAYNFLTESIELITKIDVDSDEISMSPDFKNVVTSINGKLLIANKTGNKIYQKERFENDVSYGNVVHRYEFGISQGLFWSPNGKYLAFYKNDESEVAEYPLLPYENEPLKINNIKYPMAGKKSEKVTIGLWRAENQNVSFLEIEGPSDQYLTNISWSADEKQLYIVVLNRDQNVMEIRVIDVEGSSPTKTILREVDEKYVHPTQGIILTPDGSGNFLWRSQRENRDKYFLFSAAGKLLKTYDFKGDEVVFGDFIGFDKSGASAIVYGFHNDGLDKDVFTINLKSAKVKMITNGGVHDVKWNATHNMLIDVASTPNTPYHAKIINLEGSLISKLFSIENPMDKYQNGEVELGKIIEEDGKYVLNYRLIFPANFSKDKKYPLLLYVYNGPQVQLINNAWLNGASPWMFHFANRGFLVLTVDGRGSAHRGKDFEQAVYRNLGLYESLDQVSTLKKVMERAYVNKNQIAIHGWSYGGFMTTNMILNYPDIFKVGVAGGPVLDWKYYEVMYGERYMDTPQTNPEGYKNSSMIEKVHQLKNPLLIIHGMNDDVVLPIHSFEFIKKAVDNNKKVDFFPYVGHKHNIYGKDRIHLMNKVFDYIEDKINHLD